jgi:hypothetical protein
MWKSLFLSADILVIEGIKHYAETSVESRLRRYAFKEVMRSPEGDDVESLRGERKI